MSTGRSKPRERSSCSTSPPDLPGSRMSRITTSYSFARARRSPSLPSLTRSASQPCSSKPRLTNCPTVGSSSMTRIFICAYGKRSGVHRSDARRVSYPPVSRPSTRDPSYLVLHPVVDPRVGQRHERAERDHRLVNVAGVVLIVLGPVDGIYGDGYAQLQIQRRHHRALDVVVTVSGDVTAHHDDSAPREIGSGENH